MCGRAKASFPATLPTHPISAAYLLLYTFQHTMWASRN